MKRLAIGAILFAGCAVEPSEPVVKIVNGLAFRIETGVDDERFLVVSLPPGANTPIALQRPDIRTRGPENYWSYDGENMGKREPCVAVAPAGYSTVSVVHASNPVRIRFVKREGQLIADSMDALKKRIRMAFLSRNIPVWQGRVTFAQSEVP